ncbi:MAG: hypothetical protein Q9193_006571 [Seirophora villosa]
MNAENAAFRGGAGLTRAARLLRWILGMDTTTLGPDWDTFVFSATLDPKAIYIWINWAEVKGEDDGETIYHMSKDNQHFLDEQQQFGVIGRTLYNILDYGCGKRFEALEPLHKATVSYQFEQTEGSPAKKVKKPECWLLTSPVLIPSRG